MNRKTSVAIIPLASLFFITGCMAPNVDFSAIKRPPRSSDLDAYAVFVGSWTWEAQVENAEGPGTKWSGTANWEWALDKRCLHGRLSAKSGDVAYEAAGIWSMHPRTKRYIWWMFNDWGYPQSGSASYDSKTKTWRMDYTSVGLDGTTSHGRYFVKVVDDNTLEWRMKEWADPLHFVQKLSMTGTYRRK